MTEQETYETEQYALHDKWEKYQEYLSDYDPTPQHLFDDWLGPMDFDDFCISLEEEQLLTTTSKASST